MGFTKDLIIKIISTPYVAGAVVRQLLGIIAAALVAISVLDPSLVDQWINVNAPVVIGVILWLVQLGLSLKQKVSAAAEVGKIQTELLMLKQSR